MLNNKLMDKYCKLYIQSVDKDVIYTSLLSSKILMNLNDDILFSYVDENDEKDLKKASNFEDGFLYFNYVVDIDSDSLPLGTVISFVSNVIKFLSENKIKVVASCDYEDELNN